MLKALRYLLYALIVLATTYLGFHIAAGAALRLEAGEDISWRDVSLPEGHLAESFVIEGQGLLGVRSADGLVYVRSIVRGSETGWLSPESPDYLSDLGGGEEFPAGCGPIDPPDADRWTPSPPGKVRSSIECHYTPNAESVVMMRYAILADGSVWEWSMDRGPVNTMMAPIIFFGLSLIGVAGGFFFGLTVVTMLDLGFGYARSVVRSRRLH